jgi:hypothetical protein
MTFVIDTDVLGGSDFNYQETIIEDRGRSIIVDWSQSGLNEDMEIFGYSIRFYPAEEEPKEQV